MLLDTFDLKMPAQRKQQPSPITDTGLHFLEIFQKNAAQAMGKYFIEMNDQFKLIYDYYENSRKCLLSQETQNASALPLTKIKRGRPHKNRHQLSVIAERIEISADLPTDTISITENKVLLPITRRASLKRSFTSLAKVQISPVEESTKSKSSSDKVNGQLELSSKSKGDAKELSSPVESNKMYSCRKSSVVLERLSDSSISAASKSNTLSITPERKRKSSDDPSVDEIPNKITRQSASKDVKSRSTFEIVKKDDTAKPNETVTAKDTSSELFTEESLDDDVFCPEKDKRSSSIEELRKSYCSQECRVSLTRLHRSSEEDEMEVLVEKPPTRKSLLQNQLVLAKADLMSATARRSSIMRTRLRASTYQKRGPTVTKPAKKSTQAKTKLPLSITNESCLEKINALLNKSKSTEIEFSSKKGTNSILQLADDKLNRLNGTKSVQNTTGKRSKVLNNVLNQQLKTSLVKSLSQPKLLNNCTVSTGQLQKVNKGHIARIVATTSNSRRTGPSASGRSLRSLSQVGVENIVSNMKIKKQDDKLQQKLQKEKEVFEKRQMLLKAKIDEQKKKREQKEKKVLLSKQQLDQEHAHNAENKTKLLKERLAQMEREKQERLREDAKRKKLMRAKKEVEAEERRRTEEEARMAKMHEQEELERQKQQESARQKEEENRFKVMISHHNTSLSLQQKAICNSMLAKLPLLKDDSLPTTEANHTAKIEAIIPTAKVNQIPLINGTSSKANTINLNKTFNKEDEPAQQEYVNYDISNISSGDDTDDETAPRKQIPSWAQGMKLRNAVIEQCRHPPDISKLFGVIEIIDMEKIFRQQKKYYYKRTSSAVWYSPPVHSKKV